MPCMPFYLIRFSEGKMKKITGISFVCIVIVAVLFFYFPIKVMKIKNEDEKIMTTIRLHGKQQYNIVVDTGAASSIIYKKTLLLIEDKSKGRLVKVDYNKNYAILLINYYRNKNIRMVYTREFKIQTEGDGIFGIDVLKLADYAVVNYKRERIYLSSNRPFNCILYTGSNLNEIYKPNTIPIFNNYIVCFDFKHKQVWGEGNKA